MTVPVVRQTSPWPSRRTAQSNFDEMADQVAATLPLTIDDINEAVPFINQRAIDADVSAQAAAASAVVAGEHAEAAGSQKEAAQTAAGQSAASAIVAGEHAAAALLHRDAAALAASQAADSAQAAGDEKEAAEAAKQGAIDARDAAEYWAEQAQQTVAGGIIDDESLLPTRVRSAQSASRGHFAAVAAAEDVALGPLDFATITNADESVTVTMPASPEAGQLVMVGNFTDRRDHRIGVGSAPVKGLDVGGYVLLDKARFTLTLKFISAEYGWEIM